MRLKPTAELPGAVGIPTAFAKFIGICHPSNAGTSAGFTLSRIPPFSKTPRHPGCSTAPGGFWGFFSCCRDARRGAASRELPLLPGNCPAGSKAGLLPLQGSMVYVMCNPPCSNPDLKFMRQRRGEQTDCGEGGENSNWSKPRDWGFGECRVQLR